MVVFAYLAQALYNIPVKNRPTSANCLPVWVLGGCSTY